MPDATERDFRVHARHADRHHARLVRAASFEAAAVAFIERHAVAAGDDQELKIVVHDLATGHEHCFRIDLDTGEAAPCG